MTNIKLLNQDEQNLIRELNNWTMQVLEEYHRLEKTGDTSMTRTNQALMLEVARSIINRYMPVSRN